MEWTNSCMQWSPRHAWSLDLSALHAAKLVGAVRGVSEPMLASKNRVKKASEQPVKSHADSSFRVISLTELQIFYSRDRRSLCVLVCLSL